LRNRKKRKGGKTKNQRRSFKPTKNQQPDPKNQQRQRKLPKRNPNQLKTPNSKTRNRNPWTCLSWTTSTAKSNKSAANFKKRKAKRHDDILPSFLDKCSQLFEINFQVVGDISDSVALQDCEDVLESEGHHFTIEL
jgi:hypothetical protein